MLLQVMEVVLSKYHIHGILYWAARDYVNKNYTCQLGLTNPTIAEVKLCFVLMAFMV